jgi:hypothetical protein
MNNPILFKKIISSKKEIEFEKEIKKTNNELDNIAILQIAKYNSLYSHAKDSANNIFSTPQTTVHQQVPINQTNLNKAQPKTRQVKIDEQQNSRLIDVENAFSQQYYKISKIENLIEKQNLILLDVENRFENQNNQVPIGATEKSRYCFVTEKKFGCIHHNKLK